MLILFILALIVGLAFLWIAAQFVLWDGNLHESAHMWIPFAVIGAAVLTAAVLGISGVIA